MSELGNITDRLTEALMDAEEALTDLRLGVEASVPLGAHTLSFGKRGSEWGLFLVDSSGGETQLAKMSRAIRVEAVDQLPELFCALLREHDNQLDVVKEAAQRAEAFVERVESFAREMTADKPSLGQK